MTDIRRTMLWVVSTMSLVLLWDAWQQHTGQPSLSGGPARPAASAPATSAPPASGVPAAIATATPGSTPAGALPAAATPAAGAAGDFAQAVPPY